MSDLKMISDASKDVYRPSTKKFSRSKKKNWRKFLDTKDIDSKTEESHQDLLAGGALHLKSDDSLFTIDTGSKSSKKKKDAEPTKKMSRKEFRENKQLLYCEKAVLPNAHTVALTGRKVSTKPKPTVVLKPKKTGPKRKIAQTTQNRAIVDVWTIEDHNDVDLDKLDFAEYLAHQADKHLNSGLNVKKPSTKAVKAKAVKRAVEYCHPGQSYNPALEHHKSALEKSAKKIINEDEAALKLMLELGEGVTAKKLSQYAPDAAMMEVYGENSDDEDDEDDIEKNEQQNDDSDDESEDEEEKKRQKEKIRENQKKSATQRNKEARHAQMEEEHRLKREAKKRMNDLNRLKAIKKDVITEEQQREQVSRQRMLRKELLEAQPQKLGKYKYTEEALDVQLGDELSGSLRELTPSNDMLRERFRSFQKRNMIEVRKRHRQPRKYKRKEYVKRSFKVRNAYE